MDIRDLLPQRERCPKCALRLTKGPDPCLGLIPGVSHACCGHGVDVPYVVLGGQPNQPIGQIPEIVVMHDERALAFFEMVKAAGIRSGQMRFEL